MGYASLSALLEVRALSGCAIGVRLRKDLCPACRSARRPACQAIVGSWLDWCVRKPSAEAERRMLLWRRLQRTS